VPSPESNQQGSRPQQASRSFAHSTAISGVIVNIDPMIHAARKTSALKTCLPPGIAKCFALFGPSRRIPKADGKAEAVARSSMPSWKSASGRLWLFLGAQEFTSLPSSLAWAVARSSALRGLNRRFP
jgi:hypothetical protein